MTINFKFEELVRKIGQWELIWGIENKEGEVIGWGFGAQPITSTVVSGGVLNPACLDKLMTWVIGD